MSNAEDRLREWQTLYRQWSDLEHRLHSGTEHEAGPAAAEMKVRARDLQQRCASALDALHSAVLAMRERRERREHIS